MCFLAQFGANDNYLHLKNLTMGGYCTIFVRIMTTYRRVKKCYVVAAFMMVLLSCFEARSQSLTAADVQNIIAQAVSKAVELNQSVTVSVTDQEGNLLGTFVMNGAPASTRIRSVGCQQYEMSSSVLA